MLYVHTQKLFSCYSFRTLNGEVVSDPSFPFHKSYCQRSKIWPVVDVYLLGRCLVDVYLLSIFQQLGLLELKQPRNCIPYCQIWLYFMSLKCFLHKNRAIILSLFIQKAGICLVLLREISCKCQCQQLCYDGSRYVGRSSILQWPWVHMFH